ncbi:hypothetical protein PR048_030896 [Dryococelus australis]|uniref:Uncharacterized protein n=1 Tax=Dryococelus australis TaxID=614101 RepID=A0ABQ9GCR6_9NEOP|nr:hypothetical protein PR048_030896 [Dryococelus australis]
MKQQDEPSESSVTDEVEIVRDLQALQQDSQPADIEECLTEGDFTEITNEELPDDQIITTVLQSNAEEDDIDCEDKSDSERVRHSTAK